jgi:hypothetical protein
MCDDSTLFEFLSVCSYLPYLKPNQEEGKGGGGGGFVSRGTL